MIKIVEKYFTLTQEQKRLLTQYVDLLLDWNRKINLISRQDEQNVWVRHILHSLAIAKAVNLNGAKVIDVGTGGGLPGIPLAIMFEQGQFTLIDSIGKKIAAVQDIIRQLNLANVTAFQANSKQLKDKFDFVTARAVSDFRKFYKLTRHLLRKGERFDLPNGILYLKGGDFSQEIAIFGDRITVFDLSQWFDLPFFETKKLIYLRF